MSFVTAAAIIGGSSIVAGYLGSQAAGDAADAQAAASGAAIGAQTAQTAQTRADLTPWREAGGAAVKQQADLLGLNGGAGDLNKKFTLADFWDDPVTKASYQFGLDTGTKALDNMAGARGNRNSGAQLKALTRFATDYTGGQAAGSEARFYGDQDRTFNRLAGVAGTGQTATTSGAALGEQGANTIGNLISSQGNARGAAAIGSANAWGGALTGGANTIGQMYTLNSIFNRPAAYNSTGMTAANSAGLPW